MFFTLLDKGFWNKEKDETGVEVYEEHVNAQKAGEPSFGMALLPILLPVILILLGTVMDALVEELPGVVAFLSNKTIALLLGALAAYVISAKAMNKEERDASATDALKSCGIVLLITGAGGSFGAIISGTGVADMLAATIQNISASPIVALFIAFVIAALFRVALGSGTVASITTMTIMASVPTAVGMHPVWITMACLSGSLSCGHVNDSGFWVSTNLSGFTITGGLNVTTLGNAICGGIYNAVCSGRLSDLVKNIPLFCIHRNSGSRYFLVYFSILFFASHVDTPALAMKMFTFIFSECNAEF